MKVLLMFVSETCLAIGLPGCQFEHSNGEEVLYIEGRMPIENL